MISVSFILSRKVTFLQKMKIAVYCRVSTNSRDQQNSYENQKSYFEREVSKNPDYDLVRIYADRGISGTKLYRPEFDTMLYDAGLDIIEVGNSDQDNRKKYKKYITVPSSTRKPKFDLILTKNTSRFARNVEVESILRDLAKNKVYVHFLDLNKTTENTDDITYIQIFQSFDERDSRDKSKKVMFGIQEGVKKGVIKTNPRIYGYNYIQKENRLEIISEEAEIIKLIFSLYLSGKGIRQIINTLKDNNVKTRNNVYFCKTSIRNILSNEKYAGMNNALKYDNGQVFNKNSYAKVRKDYKITPSNKIPAIIDIETFDKCRNLLNSKINYTNQKGIYNGISKYSQLLYCGKCGSIYYSNMDRGRKFYVCSNKKKNGLKTCDNPNISEKYIDGFIQDGIEKNFIKYFNEVKFQSIQRIYAEIKRQYKFINSDNSEEISNLYEQINEETESLNAYRELYVTAKADRSFLKKKIDDLEKSIEDLKSRHDNLTMGNKTVVETIQNLSKIVQQIKEIEIIKNASVNDIINEISKIKINYYNEIDGTRQISLTVNMKKIDDFLSKVENFDAEAENSNIQQEEIQKILEISQNIYAC